MEENNYEEPDYLKSTKFIALGFKGHLILFFIGLILWIPSLSICLSLEENWVKLIKKPAELDDAILITNRFFSFLSISFIFCIFFSWSISNLPRLIVKLSKKREESESIKLHLEFYISLIPTIKINSFLVSIIIIYSILYRYPLVPPLKHKSYWFVYFAKIIACATSTTLIWSVEQIIVQLMALKFHKTAYRKRIEISNKENRILTSLNKTRKNSSNIIDMFSFKSKEKYDEEKRESNEPNIFTKLTRQLFDNNIEKVDLNSSFNAHRLTEKIFFNLNAGKESNELTLEHFLPYFKNIQEAQKAFNLFDIDLNGNLTKQELLLKIKAIYKERKDLTLALKDCSQVIGELDKLFMFVFSIFVFLSWAIIFGHDVIQALMPLGTLFIGLSFVFGDTVKHIFESIIFLFIMHPYDNGDIVFFKEFKFEVKRVHLMGTQFERNDGQIIYIPSHVLIDSLIYNFSRSKNQAEQIDFQLSMETPKEKIFKLKDRINAYLQNEESRDFFPNPTFALDEIIDSNKLKLWIWLEHKSNWHDADLRWARKTREICLELNLSFTANVQKIYHVNNPFSKDLIENHSNFNFLFLDSLPPLKFK